MAEDKQRTLEVEVIEIDGVAPPPPPLREEPRTARVRIDWQHWNGRIRRLDPRWWPLWLFLGSIALVLIVTIGVVAGVVAIAFLVARRLLVSLFPFLAPPQNGTND